MTCSIHKGGGLLPFSFTFLDKLQPSQYCWELVHCGKNLVHGGRLPKNMQRLRSLSRGREGREDNDNISEHSVENEDLETKKNADLKLELKFENFKNNLYDELKGLFNNLEHNIQGKIDKPALNPIAIKPARGISCNDGFESVSLDRFQKYKKLFSDLPSFSGTNARNFLTGFNTTIDGNFRPGELASRDAKYLLTSKLSPDIVAAYPDLADLSFEQLHQSLLDRFDQSENPKLALDKFINLHKYITNVQELINESMRLYPLLSHPPSTKFRIFFISIHNCLPDHVKDKINDISDDPPIVDRIIKEIRPYFNDINKHLEKNLKTDRRKKYFNVDNNDERYCKNCEISHKPGEHKISCDVCGRLGHTGKFCFQRGCSLCGSYRHRTVDCTVYINIEPVVANCKICANLYERKLKHPEALCRNNLKEKN